jgi:hypothetical protein
MEGPSQTVGGTVEFLWESAEEMLVHIEPDRPGAPHVFEIKGALLERLTDTINEGDRVEIEYVVVEHEVIDPDAGPSETLRAEVRDVKVLGG